MSLYEEDLAELESKQCSLCWGSGICDDAEPGDISYNKWTCTNCKGTGYESEQDSIRD